MKLHLPIGLRAALLAVLSYAALPAAQAADPAVFYERASNTVTKVATQTYGDGRGAILGEVSQFDFFNADYLPGPEPAKPAAGATQTVIDAYQNYLNDKSNFSDKLQTPNKEIDASTTNWVLDVTATNLRGTNLGDENYANSCMLLGNAPTGLYEIEIENPNDRWWDNNRDEWVYREETGRLLTFMTPGGNAGDPTINKEGMGLFISDEGCVCWMVGYKCKILGIIPGWSEQQDTFDISVRIEWCPDSSLPGGGALKLRGMWYIDPETGEKLGNIPSAVGTIPADGYVIMNNIAMPENFLTSGSKTEVEKFELKNGGLATGANTGGKGSVSVSLYAENDSDEGEWRVTGKADLGAEYQIKNDPVKKSISSNNTDKVVFVGHGGCLNLTSNLAATDGKNYAQQTVKEYTYDNPTMAMADVANGGMTCSVGFSAEAGTQLVIAKNVLRSTILKDQIDAEGEQLDDEKAGVPVWLNVSGEGIVKLDLMKFYIWNGQTDNDKNRIDLKYLKEFELRNVNLTESATLDIAFNGNLTVDLGCGVFSKDATLVHSGEQGDTTIVLEAGKSAALAAIIKTAATELVDPSVDDLPADKLADADASKLTIGSPTGGVMHVGTIQNHGNVEIHGETHADTIKSTDHGVTLGAPVITANSVAADGKIVVERGSATVTGSVTAGESVLVDDVASLAAGSVTAKKVFVSGKLAVANAINASYTVDGTGNVVAYEGASSIKAGAINADKWVEAYAGASIEVYGDVSADALNTYVNTDINGKVISSGSITVTGTVNAGRVVAGGSGVTIKQTSGDDMMSGAVIDSTGISAEQIMSGAEIAIEEDGTGVVLAGALGGEEGGVKVTVGDNTVLTNAKTQSMTRAASATRISNQSIVSNQVIEADEVNIAAGTGYEITAAGLQANAITVGSTTIQQGTSSTEKVVITDLGKLSETEISAGSIKADKIRFANGYAVKNAAIESPDMHLGDGGSLENVSLVGGSASFVADGDFSFKGLKLEAGQGYSAASGGGSVMYRVGNGNADESVQAVYISGKQEDGKAKLDKLVIDASHIEFGDTEQSVVVFDSTVTGAMDVADTDVQYILKPYVVVDEANATAGSFKAAKDVATVQAELKVDDATATALDALNEMQAALTPEEKTDSPVQALHDALGLVYERDLKSRQEILQAITGASTTALADSQRRGVRDVQKNLRNRVIQLGGVTGEGDSGWVNSGIQGWAQADGSFSTTDGGEGTNGYDYSTTGATVGINMDLAPNFVLGASFSTSFGKLDVEGPDNASGNNDAYYVSLFARHQYNRWVQMLILTAGMNDMTLDRDILGYKAQGETSGTSFSAYYELGYTMALDYNYNHILQPLVSFSITSATVDGYKEKGSIGNAGLDYDGSDAVYGQVGFGLRYQGVLYESVYQRCAVLEARALVTQDFGDSTDEAEVALLGGGDGFTVKGADSTGTGFEIGLGLSIPVEQQTTVYADVDFTYSPDYTGVRANVGLRYDF